MQGDISFMALFKIDKKIINTNIGFIIFNKEKKIAGISSSCIKLMGLDVNKIRRLNNSGYDIIKLAPDLEFKKEELMQSKTGVALDWVIPVFSRKRWPKASEAVERVTNNNFNKQQRADSLAPMEI